MAPKRLSRRYRCRYCGAMLLYHLGQQHPDQVGPYLERIRTEYIATVAAEAFEVIEEGETR
jgi:hypothetical protein